MRKGRGAQVMGRSLIGRAKLRELAIMGVQASSSVQRHQGRGKGVPRGVLEHGACLLGFLECEEKSSFGWHQDEYLSAALGFLSAPDVQEELGTPKKGPKAPNDVQKHSKEGSGTPKGDRGTQRGQGAPKKGQEHPRSAGNT